MPSPSPPALPNDTASFAADSIDEIRITRPAVVLLLSGTASLLIVAAGIATLTPGRLATDTFGEEGALFGEDGVFETMTAVVTAVFTAVLTVVVAL